MLTFPASIRACKHTFLTFCCCIFGFGNKATHQTLYADYLTTALCTPLQCGSKALPAVLIYSCWLENQCPGKVFTEQSVNRTVTWRVCLFLLFKPCSDQRFATRWVETCNYLHQEENLPASTDATRRDGAAKTLCTSNLTSGCFVAG